jgi:hypothetical protein
MGNYQIRVHVEIVESHESVGRVPVKGPDGSFTLQISEADAISIDQCEQALLQTNYEAIREALSAHLTIASKKSVCARP